MGYSGPSQITRFFDMSAPDEAFKHVLDNANFTKRGEVRAAFMTIADSIIGRVENNTGKHLDDEHKAKLIYKLASYCNKQGWQTVEKLKKLDELAPNIADAIAEKPEMIMQALSIRQMLQAHDHRTNHKAFELRRGLAENAEAACPPKIIAYADDHAYKLVELTHPDHLIAQSAGIKGCCVGTLYNEEALKRAGLSEKSPQAKYYLNYAISIRNKEARIFSLIGPDDKPLATIEYDTKSKTIEQIEAAPRKIRKKTPFFPQLCQTLHALSGELGVEFIKGIPDVAKDKLLTRNGEYVRYSDAIAQDVFKGNVIANDRMSHEKLAILAANPLMRLHLGKMQDLSWLPSHTQALIFASANDKTPDNIIARLSAQKNTAIDVTHLSDLSRLPTHVTAELYSNAESFFAPRLETAGCIYAVKAKVFDLPKLATAVTLQAAPFTKHFHAPLLRKAEDIYAGYEGDIEMFDVSRLEHVEGNIHVGHAKSLSAPRLVTAGKIFSKAEKCDLPLLREAGTLSVEEARELRIPELVSTGNINAAHCRDFQAPKMVAAGNIAAECARHFNAPLLVSCGAIDAGVASIFNAPRLVKSGAIYAPNTQTYNCSAGRSDKLSYWMR